MPSTDVGLRVLRLRHLLRHEGLRWAPALVLGTATVRALGGAGADVVRATWGALDRTELPPAVLEAVAGEAAGSGVDSGATQPPPEPCLLAPPTSRALLLHWLERLAHLLEDEGLAFAGTHRLAASAPFQAMRHSAPALLAWAAREVPDGASRRALFWAIRALYARELSGRTSEADARDVLDGIAARLRPLPPLSLSHALLTPAELTCAELACLAVAWCAEEWSWEDVVTDLVRRTPLPRPAIEDARKALQGAGLLAEIALDGGALSVIATWEGALAHDRSRHFQWPHGPVESLQGKGADPNDDPARRVGALHQRLWSQGPDEAIFAAVRALAIAPDRAVRVALYDGLASRLAPPQNGLAAGERAAGPDGELLAPAQWDELLSRGRADPDPSVLAAAERLATAREEARRG